MGLFCVLCRHTRSMWIGSIVRRFIRYRQSITFSLRVSPSGKRFLLDLIFFPVSLWFSGSLLIIKNRTFMKPGKFV